MRKKPFRKLFLPFSGSSSFDFRDIRFDGRTVAAWLDQPIHSTVERLLLFPIILLYKAVFFSSTSPFNSHLIAFLFRQSRTQTQTHTFTPENFWPWRCRLSDERLQWLLWVWCVRLFLYFSLNQPSKIHIHNAAEIGDDASAIINGLIIYFGNKIIIKNCEIHKMLWLAVARCSCPWIELHPISIWYSLCAVENIHLFKKIVLVRARLCVFVRVRKQVSIEEKRGKLVACKSEFKFFSWQRRRRRLLSTLFLRLATKRIPRLHIMRSIAMWKITAFLRLCSWRT